MMREILFRGKTIKCPRFVFGDLYHDRTLNRVCILDNDIEYPINAATVGQYTGLTDKNGKRIFEGDIVVQPVRETSKHSHCIVEFHKGKFQAHYVSENRFFDRYYDINSYTKVIGNIHDNPELLKGGGADA